MKKSSGIIIAGLAVVLAVSNAQAQAVLVEDEPMARIERLFQGVRACFKLTSLSGEIVANLNEKKCEKMLPPCSTFKIPNALIALEKKAVKNTSEILVWDGEPQRSRTWEKDHNMKSAFRRSVVWFFQEMARRVGARNMQKYLDRFDYGNKDMSSGLDNFWLNRSLLISANQQLEFLRKLYNNELRLKKKTVASVKEIMIREQIGDWSLSGKTGTCSGFENRNVGWFVGHLDTGKTQYLFTTNVLGGQAARGSYAYYQTVSALGALGLGAPRAPRKQKHY